MAGFHCTSISISISAQEERTHSFMLCCIHKDTALVQHKHKHEKTYNSSIRSSCVYAYVENETLRAQYSTSLLCYAVPCKCNFNFYFPVFSRILHLFCLAVKLYQCQVVGSFCRKTKDASTKTKLRTTTKILTKDSRNQLHQPLKTPLVYCASRSCLETLEKFAKVHSYSVLDSSFLNKSLEEDMYSRLLWGFSKPRRQRERC